MSSTTGNKATQASPAKTKKRSTRKKVAKTSARKTRGSATGVKKKTVKKKQVSKKAVAKKPSARKAVKKTARSKKAATAPQKRAQAPEQASITAENKTPEDTKSLSWMSAQAASALKAVKANQAKKGHTILARTRKQSAEKHIDDESLIEIAAEMPVDNDGLIEFSTEEPLEENPLQVEVPLAAPEPVVDEVSNSPNMSNDSPAEVAPEIDQADKVIEPPLEPVQQQEPDVEPPLEPVQQQGHDVQPPVPPSPQPAKRSVLFQPALAAGIAFAALLLGFYFWPGGNDTGPSDSDTNVATQENTVIEVPATATEADSIGSEIKTVEEVATAPVAEADQKPSESTNTLTPAAIRTEEQSDHLQTAAVPPAPEPKAEPAPVVSQPVVTQKVQPAAPVQRNYRAPVYGSYPQQRQPTYPQYYYR